MKRRRTIGLLIFGAYETGKVLPYASVVLRKQESM
jgi:hypothetical protein